MTRGHIFHDTSIHTPSCSGVCAQTNAPYGLDRLYEESFVITMLRQIFEDCVRIDGNGGFLTPYWQGKAFDVSKDLMLCALLQMVTQRTYGLQKHNFA